MKRQRSVHPLLEPRLYLDRVLAVESLTSPSLAFRVRPLGLHFEQPPHRREQYRLRAQRSHRILFTFKYPCSTAEFTVFESFPA